MGWVIRFFDKTDESFVGEEHLPKVSLTELQDVFNVPPENPMYDSFPIGKEQIKFLGRLVKLEFDLTRYDYFLEFDG